MYILYVYTIELHIFKKDSNLIKYTSLIHTMGCIYELHIYDTM